MLCSVMELEASSFFLSVCMCVKVADWGLNLWLNNHNITRNMRNMLDKCEHTHSAALLIYSVTKTGIQMKREIKTGEIPWTPCEVITDYKRMCWFWLSYISYAWTCWGVLTELVLGPVAPALSRAKATMTLLFSPAQWTTIWLWESFRLACRTKQVELKMHLREKGKQTQNLSSD